MWRLRLGTGVPACRRAAPCRAAAELTHATARAWMEGVDTFILDCDGVLWRGSEPLPGASEAVAALQRAGKRVLFVTNNASKSRRQYVSKLASFGIQAASEDIVAASFAAAAFTAQAFRSQYGMHDRRKVFLVGDIGVEEELRQHGLDFVGGQSEEPAGMSVSEQMRYELDPAVGAVVVGHDPTFTYRKLCLATMYLRERPDCLFVATNPDAADRIDGDRFMPGTGGLVAAVEVCSGRKATVVGKGGPWLAPFLIDSLGLDPRTCAVVGDRLDTDVAMGKDVGMKTLLVLSGVATEREVREAPPGLAPDAWADSIAVQAPPLA